MEKETMERDGLGNVIHSRDSDGLEWWKEYDSAGREIHYRNSRCFEEWTEYEDTGLTPEEVYELQKKQIKGTCSNCKKYMHINCCFCSFTEDSYCGEGPDSDFYCADFEDMQID